MSTPSPGAGCGWRQTDSGIRSSGEDIVHPLHNGSLPAVIEEASRQAKTYGEQGWEIVGSFGATGGVAHRFSDYNKGGDVRIT
jgi:hypothetical protein